MTKPEFYLAPDGSMQPLPESGPLTLQGGELSRPGEEDPPALRDPSPWPHGTLLRLVDAMTMGVDGCGFTMVDGDVLIVDENERLRYEELSGPTSWGGAWTDARVRCLRNGEVAWARTDCVEVLGSASPLDVSTWLRMQVGETMAVSLDLRRAVSPRVGHANTRHAPARWRGYTEGGSFVVERVA